jgi:hypothetical protein
MDPWQAEDLPRLAFQFSRYRVSLLSPDRHRTKCRENLTFGPLEPEARLNPENLPVSL